MRATRQRGAIIALLDTVEEFRSAQELHDELRRRGLREPRQGLGPSGDRHAVHTGRGQSLHQHVPADGVIVDDQNGTTLGQGEQS